MAGNIFMIVGAFVSGLLGGTIPLFAYAHGWLRLERAELRRRRAEIVYELFGSRNALGQPDNIDQQSRHRFAHAINQVPVLFADNDEVIKAYDRMLTEQTNPNFHDLMNKLSKAVGIRNHIALGHLDKMMSFGIDK